MDTTAEPPVNPSTLRARRHRQRRRERVRLFSVEVPEATIEEARARRLLRPEDNRKSWPVVQACYAAQLSDAALERLINGGIIAPDERGDAGAILRGISDWLERAG
jgi:hypothetical protein